MRGDQIDAHFVGELHQLVFQDLAVAKVADDIDDLEHAAAREDADLRHRPTVVVHPGLHGADGDALEDVVERVEPALALEGALQLAVIDRRVHGLSSASRASSTATRSSSAATADTDRPRLPLPNAIGVKCTVPAWLT